MLARIYIVTFKKTDLLIRCLRSIFDGGNDLSRCEILIMNNYVPEHVPELRLPEDLTQRVTVIHNSARPAFSTGHLSRSWNECIIDGFRDILNPACEVIILLQEDAVLAYGALGQIKKHLETYDYITIGSGDEVQVITPNAIRAIGLYDERFCNIGHQEADYFRRSFLFNPQRTSINDTPHDRVHNPITLEEIIVRVPTGAQRNDPDHQLSAQYHPLSLAVFHNKWHDVITNEWSKYGYPPMRLEAKQYMLYPYFEKHLPNLDKKFVCY